jgi:excisionase family DNA binding protein
MAGTAVVRADDLDVLVAACTSWFPPDLPPEVGEAFARLLTAFDGVHGAREEPALLTPGEVAAMFRVDPKTVTKWAKAGKLDSIRTPGGIRRYYRDQVEAFLRGGKPCAEVSGG